MQNKYSCFLTIFFLLCLCSSVLADSGSLLSKADSLFEQKKYTESFDIYEKIVDEHQQASPQMLLKMAFIKEGLGDYSNALYYLNLYYLKSSDKQARNKMKDIAEEHKLSGFVINDSDFFLNLIHKFRLPLSLTLLSIACILFGFGFYTQRKNNKRPVGLVVASACLLVALFFINNYTNTHNQAIVIENHCYLMDGPSSGAGLIDVIQKGHRVKTYSDHGLWLEIKWNGEKAYIRKDKVKTLG